MFFFPGIQCSKSRNTEENPSPAQRFGGSKILVLSFYPLSALSSDPILPSLKTLRDKETSPAKQWQQKKWHYQWQWRWRWRWRWTLLLALAVIDGTWLLSGLPFLLLLIPLLQRVPQPLFDSHHHLVANASTKASASLRLAANNGNNQSLLVLSPFLTLFSPLVSPVISLLFFQLPICNATTTCLITNLGFREILLP